MQRLDLGVDLKLVSLQNEPGTLDLSVVQSDLELVSGLENLSQALKFRLMTPLGELEHLGHPDYGSRLCLLIGRLLTPEVIALAIAYVREALRREPRVEAVLSVDARPHPLDRGTLLVQAEVQAVALAAPLALSLTFTLDSGQGEVALSAVQGR